MTSLQLARQAATAKYRESHRDILHMRKKLHNTKPEVKARNAELQRLRRQRKKAELLAARQTENSSDVESHGLAFEPPVVSLDQ